MGWGVVLYLVGILALLLVLQTGVLRLYREPFQWTFGASSDQSKSLKLALKGVLQSVLIGSLLLYPVWIGVSPAAYYGPLLRLDRAYQFFLGQGLGLGILGGVYLLELRAGWLHYQPRYPVRKAWLKSGLSALSSLTVVSIEEPLFRGIILAGLVAGGVPGLLAVPVSAGLFSAAHYIRRVRIYWPAIGLAVLGVWLGVAFLRTGCLWLPMGLHSGGILAIGVHRCFLHYRGPAWLIGTQTYPIAGVMVIAIMLLGAALTAWLPGL